jgi:hypothetical protein
MVEMEGLDHNDSGLSSSVELAAAVVEFLEKSGLVAAPGSQASGA